MELLKEYLAERLENLRRAEKKLMPHAFDRDAKVALRELRVRIEEVSQALKVLEMSS